MSEPRIPTTQEIKNSIISNIEQNINQDTPALQKAFNRVLATAMAGFFTLMYKYGHWIFEQIFTLTQDEDSLILEGSEINVFIKDAVASQLSITVTGVEGSTLSTGTRFYNSGTGLVYETMDDATIEVGETTVDVTVECLISGSDGNLVDGLELEFVSPDENFENIAIVADTITDGSDKEDIEDYRARILQAKRNKPQGGAIADYKKRALEVAEITRAFPFRTAAGVVTVYPLVDDNETSRIPDSSKIAELQAYLRAEDWKPLNDTVYAGTFVEKVFDVTITELDPKTEDITTLIDSNIKAFLLEREPKQYTGQTDAKNIISKSALTAVVINSGGIIFNLTFKLSGGTDLTSYTLNNNEVCKLGTLTIS